jgi:hypothetical protein
LVFAFQVLLFHLLLYWIAFSLNLNRCLLLYSLLTHFLVDVFIFILQLLWLLWFFSLFALCTLHFLVERALNASAQVLISYSAIQVLLIKLTFDHWGTQDTSFISHFTQNYVALFASCITAFISLLLHWQIILEDALHAGLFHLLVKWNPVDLFIKTLNRHFIQLAERLLLLWWIGIIIVEDLRQVCEHLGIITLTFVAGFGTWLIRNRISVINNLAFGGISITNVVLELIATLWFFKELRNVGWLVHRLIFNGIRLIKVIVLSYKMGVSSHWSILHLIREVSRSIGNSVCLF